METFSCKNNGHRKSQGPFNMIAVEGAELPKPQAKGPMNKGGRWFPLVRSPCSTTYTFVRTSRCVLEF